jgi:chromosomal replication initiation ATPase DnaA
MSYTSAKRIIRFTAHYYDLPGDTITGYEKHQPLAQQRQIAMWLCRQDTDASYPTLGKLFGGRDHTTIMYGVRRVREMLLRGPTCRQTEAARRDIDQIRALLATGLPSPVQAELSVRRESVPA